MLFFNGRSQAAASKRLLKSLHFPDFRHDSTRPQVLASYRSIIRNARKFVDPLCREYLQAYCYEGFAAYRYLGNEAKIRPLLQRGDDFANLLKRSNTLRCDKSTMLVFQQVFTTIMLHELPLYSLTKHKFLDHKEINYRLKHLHCPSDVQSLEDHLKKIQGEKKSLFYKFLDMLRASRTIFGYNSRKLFLSIPNVTAVDGGPLPLCRQKNLVKKFYRRLLADAIRPIHPLTLNYLQSQIYETRGVSPENKRFYIRRLKECLPDSYTVRENSDGSLQQVKATTERFLQDPYRS